MKLKVYGTSLEDSLKKIKKSNLVKRGISLTMATMMLLSVTACSRHNDNNITSNQVIEQTDAITKNNLLCFDYLEESEQKEIKKILAGLHMSDEYLKNDEMIAELLEIVLENKDYASTVDFIETLKKPKSYHTSDGKISFIKENEEENILYIKKNEDNNLVIKEIRVNQSFETKNIMERTYCNENGSVFQGDTWIDNYGYICLEYIPEITYSIFEGEKLKSYCFHHGHDTFEFDSIGNTVNFYSNDEISYHYGFEISDDEKQEIMLNYNAHNHKQLLSLYNKLLEKYKNNHSGEFYSCYLDFPNSDKNVWVYIGKIGDSYSLNSSISSLYHDGDSDYFDDTDYDSNIDSDLTIYCDITDAQYDTLKKYIQGKDERVISYVKQIYSEHKAAETIKNGQQAEKGKVYTK